jgi:hypothetical protein
VARLELIAEVGIKLGSHGRRKLSNHNRLVFGAFDLPFARVRVYNARTNYLADHVTRPSVHPRWAADMA